MFASCGHWSYSNCIESMLTLTLSRRHLLLLFPAVGTLHLNQNLIRKTCYLKLQESISQSGGADSVIFGCKICKLVDLSFIPQYIFYVVIEKLSTDHENIVPVAAWIPAEGVGFWTDYNVRMHNLLSTV